MSPDIFETSRRIFLNTEQLFHSNQSLIDATTDLIANTRVYSANFSCARSIPEYDTHITLENSLTLMSARKLAHDKKVCVLNFADAVHPGGYVRHGGNAQEEYLCKSSNLIASLESDHAKRFYDAHRAMLASQNGSYDVFLATDTAVYSPSVTVFKIDCGYNPMFYAESFQMYTPQWITLDVITCAAPKFPSTGPTISDDELMQLFEQRIHNIFEIALDNETDSIVLGAYGCGEFHNPPEIVATAFKSELSSPRYRHGFQDVVFAIPGSSNSRNRQVFEQILGGLIE